MLSLRLESIANLVKKNQIIADIGSDHALLPIYLVLNNKVKKAYAIDNKKGPLQAAQDNIDKHNLNDKVIPILSDGLDKLPDDAEAIIIAGMGVNTIINILDSNKDKVLKLKHLIIQANNKQYLLREYLEANYFKIDKEVFIKDKDIYYTIMSISNNKTISKTNHYISEYLIKENDAHYINYLKEYVEELKSYQKYRNDDIQLSSEISSIESILKEVHN